MDSAASTFGEFDEDQFDAGLARIRAQNLSIADAITELVDLFARSLSAIGRCQQASRKRSAPI